MTDLRPDVAVIGSGVGGAAAARQLAAAGLRVLILERGERLPEEPQRSDPEAVFVEKRYRSRETWQDAAGRRFRPGQHYQLGGHTKFYGAAMFRFRRSDFEEVVHEEGVSPAWPVSYEALEPFYAEAERIFGVRGAAGIDPTEPPRGPTPMRPSRTSRGSPGWRRPSPGRGCGPRPCPPRWTSGLAAPACAAGPATPSPASATPRGMRRPGCCARSSAGPTSR